MAVDASSEEALIIRQLIPISRLSAVAFSALCAQLQPQRAEQGAVLFKRGDESSDLFYLLDGSVNLQTDTFTIETINAGSESARFAIGHQIPRKVDAVANSRILFLRLNADMMKSTNETAYEEHESTMMVEDLDEGEDWMTALLKLPVFRSLPPANLQKLLMSLGEVSYKAGDVIIHQGAPGDFYYIIKKGQALISRKPSPNAKEIKLAVLNDLDTFGEDALISGESRSTSITATTDIVLYRLAKEQFINLIKQPTLKYIDSASLPELLTKGAVIIDVRGPDEFKSKRLPNSVNVPFFSLRMYLKTLNRQQPIVVVCKDGKTSETAAFILHQNKFNAFILRNGIAALPPEQLNAEPASFVIDDGTETGNLATATTEAAEAADHGQPVAEDMRKVLQELKARCSTLEAEKMTLELKCASLARQLEKCKTEFENMRGR